MSVVVVTGLHVFVSTYQVLTTDALSSFGLSSNFGDSFTYAQHWETLSCSFVSFFLFGPCQYFLFNTGSEWEFYKPIAYREIVSY